jgi:predicted metal-dependent phosphoesterase TrpH
VEHVWATLSEAVSWIKEANGVAVIAHPGRYRLTELQKDHLYVSFKDFGGQAIEVVTGSHTPQQYQEYEKIALRVRFLCIQRI